MTEFLTPAEIEFLSGLVERNGSKTIFATGELEATFATLREYAAIVAAVAKSPETIGTDGLRHHTVRPGLVIRARGVMGHE